MAEPCLALAEELSRRVYEACRGCDCLLLSGGVDTTFIAASTARRGHRFNLALTSTYRGMGEDVRYAAHVAERLELRHLVVEYSDLEAEEGLEDVLSTLKTFDPVEVRCSLSVYMALRRALAEGCRRVATGDGADELFIGYDFLLSKPPSYVDAWVRGVVGRWRFSSVELGRRLGLEVIPAYAGRGVVELALKAPYSCKVLEARGRLWGKALMRLWLEGEGFEGVAWRLKDPIDSGSGSKALSSKWALEASRGGFDEALKDGLSLPSGSHVYLYARFKRLGLRIPKPSLGEKPCPVCGAPLEATCRFCGAYLDEDGRLHVYSGP
jgi:asparagine synthase (glutamine-hydrolysing)